MKKKIGIASVVGLLMVLLLPALGYAEGTSCGFETVIVPDGRIVESTIPGSTTFWFLLEIENERSYSIEIKSRIAQWNVFPGTMTVFSGTDGCSGTSTLTTRNTVTITPRVPNTARRESFIGVNTRHRMELVNSTTSAIEYTFSVVETTLYSPRWSTFAGFFTSYGFQNTTNATINGTLTMVNGAGTTVTTFNVAISAGLVAFTDTIQLGVGANDAGSATFTHDGPPGAVVADAFIQNFNTSPPVIQPVRFEAPRQGN